MYDIVPHLENLAQLAHPEGGWGYVAGAAPQIEPTCLGLLALSLDADRYQDLIAKGMQFLATCGGDDGSYRLSKGRREAIWPTAQVLFVRTVLGANPDSLKKSASLLLHVRGQSAAQRREQRGSRHQRQARRLALGRE